MDKTILIGRKKEQEILKNATFLIKSVYDKQMAFQMSGIQNASNERQIENFAYRLSSISKEEEPIPTPKNWFRAFTLLIDFLNKRKSKEKYVVFFDELPWMAGQKSDFIQGLSFFWNSWAVDQNIVVVICGSAASWMVQKVVNDRGGLHNRITRRINLKPFNLSETMTYFHSRNVPLDRYHTVQVYMALGGIPHYLKEIEKGKSAVQNINDICFSEGGLLRDEFNNLYPALFNNSERHVQIIRALATKRQGMTRIEISDKSKVKNGGTLTKVLQELELSGFITAYYALGKKKKDKLFRLTDEYSLFYLHFIEKNIYQGADTWQHLSQTQSYKTWSGYTFESICIKHLSQIKNALNIGGVYAIAASFYKKGTATEKGAQIDLVLDRKDQVINLFEIKFYQGEFTLTKANAQILKEKQIIFQEATNTNKLIFWTFITPFGLKQNEHSLNSVNNSLTLEALFIS